ncbi:UNVERIFIED_CONTAM: hypothetical protein Slati_1362900 [Sesamum latifolium]|uniref:Uncharacterized protein n=1 Tax=Sesamum latifolium TaxID=2727402 RepID=A0AAW2XJV1_9LAMI
MGILHVVILGGPGQEGVKFGAGFLAKDLKKSPSNNPCAKALALTFWVVEGTSKEVVLNLWKYSFRDSPSFWRIEKMLNSVFRCLRLLAN